MGFVALFVCLVTARLEHLQKGAIRLIQYPSKQSVGIALDWRHDPFSIFDLQSLVPIFLDYEQLWRRGLAYFKKKIFPPYKWASHFEIESAIGVSKMVIQFPEFCFARINSTWSIHSKQEQLWLTVTRWFQRVRSWGLVCVMRSSKGSLVSLHAACLGD